MNVKKKEISEGGKMQGSNMTYSDGIKKEIDILNGLKKEAKSVGDKVRKIQDEISRLDDEQRSM